MSQSLEQAVKEVFGNQAYYGMFTDFGNDAVDAIVRSAKILKMDWSSVESELEKLSMRVEFEEATDTMVREMVYAKLGF